jgi:high affinity Mn2+ porin
MSRVALDLSFQDSSKRSVRPYHHTRIFRSVMRRISPLSLLLLVSLIPAAVVAQDSAETSSYHFQLTGIQQAHPSFEARYTGNNSLLPTSENLLSVTATLFLGRRLWEGGEVYFDPELQAGSGFSSSRGVAGFPNGEIYRVDNPAPRVFIARLFFRQHFQLEREREWVGADQNQLAGRLPASRLTLTIGRFSLTDFFDDNSFSHDPRTQFMNWALWAGGAWDYAADTRGYNWGIVAQLFQPTYSMNVAAVLVPSEANGPFFDHHIGKAYSLNLELVKPFSLLELEGKLHLITFLNRANMGTYRTAIDRAMNSGGPPDIDRTNEYCSKYGFVISAEQPVSKTVGLFARYSWNDGRTETWAFTEIDRSFHAGLLLNGGIWNRPDDNAGLAGVINALSEDHREYLAAGGYGFIVGDGALNYALEQIVEAYYNFRMTSTLWLSVDDQIVVNPGYNRDRGPVVNAFAMRVHVEF